MQTMNRLDIARGIIHESGVTFLWINDVTHLEAIGFDTFDEVLTYVSQHIDTFNVTVEQGFQKRQFTIWEMPWIGGDLDEWPTAN